MTEGLRIPLSLLQPVYMVPITTDPGTGSTFCTSDGVQPKAFKVHDSQNQTALIVLGQAEAVAPERLREQGFPASNRTGLFCQSKSLNTTL